jgi:hypothetical protein
MWPGGSLARGLPWSQRFEHQRGAVEGVVAVADGER